MVVKGVRTWTVDDTPALALVRMWLEPLKTDDTVLS